ncbi:MAG TPA: ADP-ribosylglycohydrolase family protein, partial [Roseiflexaceae bacterium]|nr:ADP-ribosylglycohydrolase family protein [Roseiflexaceae bacterium]
LEGPRFELAAGASCELEWTLPDTNGEPIAEIGIALTHAGTIYLDWLTWEGTPRLALRLPANEGRMWQRAWVEGLDQAYGRANEEFRLIQNEGRGLLITGTREWRDYTVRATLTPHMASACGLAARVQGMRRFYALQLLRAADGTRALQLLRALDGDTLLAEAPFDWQFGTAYTLELHVAGNRIQGAVDGQALFEVNDNALASGGIALVVEEGRVAADLVEVLNATT